MWLFTTISVGPTTAYVLHAAIICTRCCHVRPAAGSRPSFAMIGCSAPSSSLGIFS